MKINNKEYYSYIISSGKYEDIEEVEILHENIFTEDEFNTLIEKVIIEEILSQTRYCHLWTLKDVLIQKYGFVEPEKIICSYHISYDKEEKLYKQYLKNKKISMPRENPAKFVVTPPIK